MLHRKVLTPIQEIWNRYHVSQGMADHSKFYEHQSYATGMKKEKEELQDPWSENYSIDFRFSRKANKEKSAKMEKISERNYNFRKQAETIKDWPY